MNFRTVHLCLRLSDKKHVIIKQIPVEQMTKEERQAALTEVRVLSMLSHPNIIEYYENFLEDKALMIVMEYAQGKWQIGLQKKDFLWLLAGFPFDTWVLVPEICKTPHFYPRIIAKVNFLTCSALQLKISKLKPVTQ